jgi:cell division protein FtsN
MQMNLSRSKQQRGGTLLGLIIGALIGLGAALAVAVYVTKVPVPFMNKNQPRSAETDAAEAKKNKDWDPNVPLAGKNAVKPAPAPVPAASAPINPTTSTDPLGDLAKAKSEGKADAKPDVKPDVASSTPGADPFSYFIQAGAFRTPEDSEQQRAKLSLLGFQAKVTEREQSGRTVYRVRLGPFDKKDEADKVKEKLDGSSIETALVRVQR